MPGPRQHLNGEVPRRIRPAVVEDSSAIAEFQTVCWRTAYAGLVPRAYLDRVGVAEREVRWRERLLGRARAVALAEVDDHVVGVVSWCGATIAEAPGVELASLYVDPALQGVGLGGQLLRHALREEPAHLWVFEDNLRAQTFYRRHRFSPDGRRTTDADTGLSELLYVRG